MYIDTRYAISPLLLNDELKADYLVSYPGLVLESFASRLLSNIIRNYYGVMLDMKEPFVEIIERY